MVYTLQASINSESLWRGTLLATIAHAFGVAHYPDLFNLQSWDVYTYSVQNNMGTAGSICFPAGSDKIPFQCAGSFFEPRSARAKRTRSEKFNFDKYFAVATPSVRSLAERTLSYLLDGSQIAPTPRITTAMWSDHDGLLSLDQWDQFLQCGGYLIQKQLLPQKEALLQWQAEYTLTDEETGKVWEIWGRRITDPGLEVYLSSEELACLQRYGRRGLEQSGEVLNSVNIWLYPPEE